MIVLGLTGSIAMGKTTAAAMLRRLGVPVHDADATVHRLLGDGGAGVAPVLAAFPGTEAAGDSALAIDRTALGRRVFDDPAALARLESILHPLVREREHAFLAAAARHRRPLVVLDIPLLFETGGDARCDAVAVVTAPAFLQRQRALARPGMTAERLSAVLARQMADGEKRRRADFVIPTGLGRAFSQRAIQRMVGELDSWRPRHWPPKANTR